MLLCDRFQSQSYKRTALPALPFRVNMITTITDTRNLGQGSSPCTYGGSIRRSGSTAPTHTLTKAHQVPEQIPKLSTWQAKVSMNLVQGHQNKHTSFVCGLSPRQRSIASVIAHRMPFPISFPSPYSREHLPGFDFQHSHEPCYIYILYYYSVCIYPSARYTPAFVCF